MSSVVIHHNNIDLNIFQNRIKFKTTQDVDNYISTDIISELLKKEFDVIFIKDNLSSNYLELLGLRVAYHIRLSAELEDKKYLPIVILSDLDGYTLNKLEPMAHILFSKNIFIIPNKKKAIEKIKTKKFENLTEKQYQTSFLDKIQIEPSKDTSGSHDIANRWSIYRWAEILDTNSEVLEKNKNAIENQLYFKYLKALNKNKDTEIKEEFRLYKKGKVLLIDDEWDKGWKDIIDGTLNIDNIEFDCLEYTDKDIKQFGLQRLIKEKIINTDPDVVILDLRFLQSDHENQDIEEYTGIKILHRIHEINAGIQVIMLTATSKSTILEKLYEKKILGYIKKEHPEDKSIDTVENINKFFGLIDKGLEKKYLKELWNIQQEILNLNIFKLTNQGIQKIYFEISNLFDIAQSGLDKKSTFFILSIYNIIELIVKQFDYPEGRTFKHIVEICNKLELYDQEIELSKIICTRNHLIHLDDKIKTPCLENTIKNPLPSDFVNWLIIVFEILKKIDIKLGQNKTI